MEYSIIKDGEVLTRIVADKDFAETKAEELGGEAVKDKKAQIGFKKEGGKWKDKRAKKAIVESKSKLDKLADLLVSKNILQAEDIEEL